MRDSGGNAQRTAAVSQVPQVALEAVLVISRALAGPGTACQQSYVLSASSTCLL